MVLAMSGGQAEPAPSPDALPSFQAARQAYRASDLIVLDRQDHVLQRVRQDFQGRRGDWLALEDISPALLQAVLVSEDRRFHEHHGVDVPAIAAAAWQWVANGPRRGASTVSMQLVGMLDEHLRAYGARTPAQKVRQVVQAWALERRWDKDEILEAYLNLAPFRGELVGVDSAARVLFQKHAAGLNARESALLAAMLRSPNVAAGLLARRACGVLEAMDKPEACDNLTLAAQSALRRSAAPFYDGADLAPHAARRVAASVHLSPSAGDEGVRVRSTLEGDLQRAVLSSVQRRLGSLNAGVGVDAAVVVLNNATGDVLAYVGSAGAASTAPWVDHAQALRQAGSTLKPFLYAQAFDELRLTPASLLDDSPVGLATASGLYTPQNYDERFSGWVTSRTALAASLNIPAVRVLTMVSPEAFHDRLLRLGLPLTEEGGFYGYSLALGSADVSLLSLTNAFRALANGGRTSPVRWLADKAQDAAVAGPPVFSESAAWMVGDVLSDRQARVRTFGMDSPLETTIWSAVKTGTSKDMRDNWCLGWSSLYTVGVWVGNSAGDAMREVSGVSGAGPIWQDIMNWLGQREMMTQPAMPEGVVQQRVSFEPSFEPPRLEVFMAGTQQSVVRAVARQDKPLPEREDQAIAEQKMQGGSLAVGRPRIAGPVDGTLIALDPDIPPANQRLQLRAANVPQGQEVYWLAGTQTIGQGSVSYWLPMPGRQVLTLTDKDGTVLDRVSIQVRGATLAVAP
ncbi:penicillin-binding protein 1C [Pusillimonas sp. CC-YST705]|uniref:peptidoglycan glycosyltransferase n=2 Tax=Mesopusillimonas faecipullorum TaxID=2755040 RepID=A0ABS8CB09_9BURK|nr:penicillin-binding protein 1C [Mesopusillimonas faecipullorum]